MKQLTILFLSLFFVLVSSCDENEIYNPCNTDTVWYVDADGDGYGTGDAVEVEDCTNPEGYSTNNSDCNDTNPDVHEESTFYRDMDEDGFGDPAEEMTSCNQPDGYVANSDDCNDDDANITEPQDFYVDGDGDGYGAGEIISTCTPEDNYVENDDDCDDTDSSVWEGQTWYEDADGDGLGNPDVSQFACSQPDGYVANSDDDDDTNGDNGGGNDDGEFGYYYQLAIGNTWVYDFDGSLEKTSEVVSSENDNGIEKYTVTSSGDGESQDGVIWYSDDKGYAEIPIGGVNQLYDATILDDTKAVGEGWSETFTQEVSGVSIAYIYEYDVLEIVDGYELPNGNAYDDVKKVKQTLSSSIEGAPANVLSESFYYWGKGIGLVYWEFENTQDSSTSTQQLVSYEFP